MVERKLIRRENYFLVLAYLDYQSQVMQSNQKTIKRKWAHLLHLLNWAADKPFNQAHKIEPIFPVFLTTARNDNIDNPLSASSMQRACGEARSFFSWAKLNDPAQFKDIKPLWISSIRPSRINSTQAELVEREYYPLEDIRKILKLKPERLIDQRDQAALAFLFLSGMRISAFVTLPIFCVDLENLSIDQLPSAGVKTKNSKAARTFLLPINDLLEVVKSWDQVVRSRFSQDDFWYPNLTTDGMDFLLDQQTGKSETRRIGFSRSLKRLCKLARIPYRSPHKIRNGHGVYVVKQAKDIEDFKAYSQNMMHENMQITDSLYGRLSRDDIKAVVTNSKDNENKYDYELFRKFMHWLEDQNK